LQPTTISDRLLQDFVSAVMDVDYSPTGREFVAGSYDRSVRIFAYQGGHSREVRLHWWHTSFGLPRCIIVCCVSDTMLCSL
jgi:WD40 repeat protein